MKKINRIVKKGLYSHHRYGTIVLRMKYTVFVL